MNPANYQNMAAPGMIPQGLQQQGAMQRSNASQQVQHIIFRAMQQQQQQQQQPLQGWQATVQVMGRVIQVYQLYILRVSSICSWKPQTDALPFQGLLPTLDQTRY